MRPRPVCLLHRYPVFFDSDRDYSRHMRDFHRQQYNTQMQARREKEKAMRAPAALADDMYREYYGEI